MLFKVFILNYLAIMESQGTSGSDRVFQWEGRIK